ncbi:MAG: HlyD family secretion protein, partial [Ignavibacteria bacterium]|nr:HlyD family secretion protein [Ignavibacteria bacterium]
MNKQIKKRIINILVIILLLSGITWIATLFIHIGGEYTNNAYVEQEMSGINSRINGFIKKIYFADFQSVNAGDTLLQIEDAEFRLELAQAEANYQNALSGKQIIASSVNTAQNNIYVSDASIDEALILLKNAEIEHNRYAVLLSKGAATQQNYDAVQTNYEASKAKYEMLIRQKQSTALIKKELEQKFPQTASIIKIAEANLELAKLNLSYTIITSPCNGTIGRKTIQEGELVAPGYRLLEVINSENKYIIANFRETQIPNIKIGNKVEIKIDAFPEINFEGVVEAISNASGSQYSHTSDRSVGNFVKVEQRIPVKILFTNNNAE